MKLFTPALVLLACFVLASCSPKQPGVKAGSISKKKYEAPGDLFTIAVPQGEHVKARDAASGPGAGFISFLDDLGTFYRLQYSPARGTQRAELGGEGADDAYRKILNDEVVNPMRSDSPISTVLDEEAIQFNGRPAYFAVIQLPGRATVSIDDGQGNWVRGDDVRAVLLFTHGDEVLTALHSESPIRQAVSPTSDFERIDRLRKEVMEFAKTIEFKEKR
ncbi:MAG TPA: hypothetical protein VFC78_06000 [Tepidisphaeraceae bacterium]|nr:hypothetical protein [Tepidisphaeraceae bacterium]